MRRETSAAMTAETSTVPATSVLRVGRHSQKSRAQCRNRQRAPHSNIIDPSLARDCQFSRLPVSASV